MMRNIRRRLMSILLTLVMTISLFPMQAVPALALTTGVTEHFSDELVDSHTFTTDSFAFTLGGNLSVKSFPTYGWTGKEETGTDDYYVDNLTEVPFPGPGVVGWIQIDPTATFQVNSIYVFPGEDETYVSSNGTIIIKGSLGGTEKFTETVLSEEINIYGATNGGWTYVDLSSYNNIEIDKLEFELTGALRYLAIDAFEHESTLIPLNNPPTVSGLPANITVTEDTQSNVNLSAANFSDADGDALTVTLAASAGSLTSFSAGGVTISGSGTGTLILSGTVSNINAFLDTESNIQYIGALNQNGSSAASITVNCSDGTVDPLLGTVSVNITAVNDDPTMTGVPTDITAVENRESNVDLSGTYFFDVDAGANSVTLTLMVSAGTLEASAGGGISVTGSGTSTLNLSGPPTYFDFYLNTVSNIKYTSPLGVSGNDAETLTLTANDGGNTGAGGGTLVALGTVNIDITPAPPAIVSVTSANADRTYGIGETIQVMVTFTKNVTVTGTPQLTLETGTIDSTAEYASGSGTNALLFTYTVQGGNISADLEYTATNALSLNGGTIRLEPEGVNAALTLPAPGASGSLSANKEIVIDAVAPSAPSTPGLATSSDTGTSNTDNITKDTTPTFTGTAEANSTITIYADGMPLGTTTADGSGNWSYTAGVISAGVHTITATATDGVGNTSAASAGLAITIDVTAPSAPSTPDLASSSDTGTSITDNITKDTTPTFIGTAEANSTITIYANGTSLGTTTADGSGNWSYTAGVISPGVHTITATAADAAGNMGAASAGLSIIIDSASPTATVSMEKTALTAGESTVVTFTFSETINGFTNANLTISNGALTPVSSANGGITYTATFTADSINADINTIDLDLAGITDIAGNSGSGSVTSGNYTIILATAPGAPTAITATAGDGKVTVSFTAPASDGGAAITSYTVTSSPGGITATGAVSPITVTGLTNGTAYTFMVKATNSVGTGAASASSNSVTPNRASKDKGSSGTPTKTYQAEVTDGDGGSILPVTVNTNTGSASIDAGAQSKLISDGKTIVITVPPVPNISAYTLGIPVPGLSTAEMQGGLTVDTDKGMITVPSNMLAGVRGTEGDKAQITIGEGDKADLPEDVKKAIDGKPLIQLTLSIDGKRIDWNNPDAPVTVSIPYTPTQKELANPESIVIWYIDGSGNVIAIPNGNYDSKTGTVIFSTTHFSNYAVAYNPVSFNDVTTRAWYHKAVNFVAARGITHGTGGGNFSPGVKLKRGEFIVMLMRAYGISPDDNLTNNFADAGDTYYTGYLAAAKRLGISAGIGNNQYAPGKEITRQEMFALLYNALNVIGQLPEGSSGKALADYGDAGQISSWATEAMTLLVKTGTVGGSNGVLTPLSTTTRAEMAQVLYNLLGK